MKTTITYRDGNAVLGWHSAGETFTFTADGSVPALHPTVGALPTVDHVLARLDELGIYNLSPDSLSRADDLQRCVQESVGHFVFTTSPDHGLVVLTPSGRLAAVAEFIDGTALGVGDVDRERLVELMVVHASPFMATDRASPFTSIGDGYMADNVAAEFGAMNLFNDRFSCRLADVADWVDAYCSGGPTLSVEVSPEQPITAAGQAPSHVRNRQLAVPMS